MLTINPSIARTTCSVSSLALFLVGQMGLPVPGFRSEVLSIPRRQWLDSIEMRLRHIST
jgi:hypothetical protein